MSSIQQLESRDLVVVTGKGGVGKSSVAAALGVVMARGGRRVLVLEIDPRESVHQMLAAPPSDGDILEVAPDLYLQNLQPRQVLDQVVRERLRFEAIFERVLKSPIYQHFTEGAPGLKEMAILGHCLLLVEGKVPGAAKFDTVVLDAPATGHGVSLLAAPLLVADVIRQGPIAHMTADVAAFISRPDRSGVVVVTLAEEMPVSEAIELRQLMDERLDRQPDLLVVNALYPPVDDVGAGQEADPLTALWRQRRGLNERELARLDEDWTGPRLELPLLAVGQGPALTEALAARMEGS
ncbi:MAG: ArsA-related P-loop ATPase [Thermoanaerobaculia bacterium]